MAKPFAGDPELAKLLEQENKRQAQTIRLIPSENYASAAVLAATGSVLANDYSEGYPGKRYYQGQEIVDQIERLAIKRACNLFGADHANVQPYSGSVANLAAYFSLLEPGDKIMGMSLTHGGHLTHGWKVSASAKLFQSVQYTVDKDSGLIDYDALLELAKKERPRLIVCGATAYPRMFDFARFGAIAQAVGAYLVADIAHIAGLVAAGCHPSPVAYADLITTTTHKTLRGPRGAMILSTAKHAAAVDRAVFPFLQGGPHNNTTAAIATCLQEASQPAFKVYAKQIIANAKALAAELLAKGYQLVSGGTDNHLLLIDLTPQAVTGKAAALALERAGIVVNANTIPFDPNPPLKPSGIRLGTPAVTSRGMKETEMKQIANWLDQVIQQRDNSAILETIKKEVEELCAAFPAPGLLPH